MDVIEIMMVQLRDCCKVIPWLPDQFDAWFALVNMVKEHVYCFSSCKVLRALYAETHRRMKLQFLHWPIFSREERVRAAIALLRVGDVLDVGVFGGYDFVGVVMRAGRRIVTFKTDDKDDESPYSVRANKITYLCMK